MHKLCGLRYDFIWEVSLFLNDTISNKNERRKLWETCKRDFTVRTLLLFIKKTQIFANNHKFI